MSKSHKKEAIKTEKIKAIDLLLRGEEYSPHVRFPYKINLNFFRSKIHDVVELPSNEFMFYEEDMRSIPIAVRNPSYISHYHQYHQRRLKENINEDLKKIVSFIETKEKTNLMLAFHLLNQTSDFNRYEILDFMAWFGGSELGIVSEINDSSRVYHWISPVLREIEELYKVLQYCYFDGKCSLPRFDYPEIDRPWTDQVSCDVLMKRRY